MTSKKGKSVFAGVAIGKIFVYKKQEHKVADEKITDTASEMERLQAAKASAAEQLQQLYEKTIADAGEEEAMIIDVQLMMLDDGDYNDAIADKIENEHYNASYAVRETGEEFAEVFANMDDDYMRARAVDVRDISNRLVATLAGNDQVGIQMEGPSIVLAEDLAPSETVQFDKDKILAFVTRQGSSNSHTAILARTMNIPSLIQADIELEEELNGRMGIVDGFTGTLFIDPDEVTVGIMEKKKQEVLEKKKLLEQLKGKENVTLDGQKVNIYSNIGSLEDIDAVLANDSGGIGLFRSEFIYLGRDNFPSEDEQFAIYKEVLSRMEGRKVIIRTLDIGADKQADYFGIAKEENPAMGFRAIRICLERREIFRTQLRAIFRASVYGTTSIMFPMIISVAEVKLIKEVVAHIKEELDQEGLPYGQVELGIMIETPAAVMISDELAKEVDFFSIGTNDLTQYTLAIDRQNQQLDNFYDSHHPAVLRMIKMTCENAHANGIWCGICGELASDTRLTSTFLGMGIDELSVSPVFTLDVRKAVRETTLK